MRVRPDFPGWTAGGVVPAPGVCAFDGRCVPGATAAASAGREGLEDWPGH